MQKRLTSRPRFRPRAALAPVLLLLAASAACDRQVDGLRPVLSGEPSPAEVERFARRLHLDVTGAVPGAAYLEEARVRLAEAGNSASARAELARDLLETRAFADHFVAEVDNRAFGGDAREDRFQLLCAVARLNDPACQACPGSQDPCAGCACARIAELSAERVGLSSAAEDLAGGTSSAEIERRFAESAPFSQFQAPEQTAQLLFETFLGRPAEPDEVDNAQRMIFGIVIAPGDPAGLLFQRHGSDFSDLMDIFFGAEVYREAAVGLVFRRYLGRPADQAELTHFAADLDPAGPDVRDVIRAVLSSREYFDL